MSKANSLREEIRLQQKASLEGKPFSYKAKYFVQYYKVHVLVALAFIVFVCSLVKAVTGHKDNALSVVLINANPDFDFDAYIDEYASIVGIDEKHDMSMDASYYMGDNMNNYQEEQRFFIATAAGKIDVVIAPKTYFEKYALVGYMSNLTWIMSEDELAAYDGLILEVQQDEEHGGELEMSGVDVTNMKAVVDNEWFKYVDEPIYLGIPVETENPEQAIAFLAYLQK